MLILNPPRRILADVVIHDSGRIQLRSRICRLLSLHTGHRILFCATDHGQLAVIRADGHPDALPLSGRTGQLHASSVLLVRIIYDRLGIPADTPMIQLSLDAVLHDLPVVSASVLHPGPCVTLKPYTEKNNN